MYKQNCTISLTTHQKSVDISLNKISEEKDKQASAHNHIHIQTK